MPRGGGFSSFVQHVANADSKEQKELRVRIAELEEQLLSLGVQPAGSDVPGPVASFLSEAALGQYASRFKEEGYNDLVSVCCMEERHMKELGMPPGHVLKLQRLLEERRRGGYNAAGSPQPLLAPVARPTLAVPASSAETAGSSGGSSSGLHRPGIYKCVHGPRVAIRASASPTGAVLDTVRPGALMRVVEVVSDVWARLDDDEVWARWTSSWPRRPKGLDEDGSENAVPGAAGKADKDAVPPRAFILIDGTKVGIPNMLVERLEDEEAAKADWPFRAALEARCEEVNFLHRRRSGKESAAEELRQRFVDTALDYVGTPYHRSCHEPGNSRYKPGSKLKDAPLFLDHMQLIQKVVDDLKEDFGFLLVANCKPADCRSTLPIAFEEPADCKPGDLIFYEELLEDGSASGRIAHVEIFLGGASGSQSIGSMAWHAHSRTGEKDGVQVFDDFRIRDDKGVLRYRFHCHSIETWLLAEETSFAHGQLLLEKQKE
eukprot:TRINITY_DN31216_c0_g1_i2.p1 TRINITY_DN31216_c0_g1~~TRINITY_DN31216_c0_g1_i2.p1  ORF type:complete len:490 (+),score=121.74 TRINITY_DN31216_c0_g1_i2:37-1506(+)